MSIASKITLFPGSSEVLTLESSGFDEPSLLNTSALLSVDGSKSAIKSISGLSTKGDNEAHWVIALIDSRGPSGEVGIAAMSTLNQECIVVEISDSARFTRTLRFLTIYVPALIVTCDTSNSRLPVTISESIPGVPIQKYPRAWFSERAGRAAINKYSQPKTQESLLVSLEKRFYALSSFAALIQWIEEGGDRIRSQSLEIKYSTGEDGAMVIDFHSSTNLELVKSLDSKEKNSCLLSSINQCSTPMGTRLLRSNLLQPLTDISTISLRQETARVLANCDSGLLWRIDEVLKEMSDIDRILSAMIWCSKKQLIEKPEKRVHFVLTIKQFLMRIQDLIDSINGLGNNELLESIHEALSGEGFVEALLNKISEYIDEDISYGRGAIPLHQRCFAVKVGVDSLLDVARKTLAELTEDILEYVSLLKSQLNLEMTAKLNGQKGYVLHLVFDPSKQDLPSELIVLKTTSKTTVCTTLDLLKMNQRLKDSFAEIFLLSDQYIEPLINRIVLELYEEIIDSIPKFYRSSEAVALFDMLICISKYTGVSVDFSAKQIQILQCHHPIMLSMVSDIVPNDYVIDESEMMIILTGANMSGKSTYLRQFALNSILAQVGFPLKAESVETRIFKRLYTKIGSDDELESNMSSFMMEMTEMSDILQTADQHSLVIIDELGRGTSTVDGVSIAIAICKRLIHENKCLTFMATHYVGLVEYMSGFPSVKTLYSHTDFDTSNDQLRTTFRVRGGIVADVPYGILLARQIGLPVDLVSKAENIRKKLCDDSEFSQAMITKRAFRRRKLVMKTGKKLLELLDEKENMAEAVYDRLFQALKDEFIKELNM